MERVEEMSGQMDLWERVSPRESVIPSEARDRLAHEREARDHTPLRPRALQRALDRIHSRYGSRGVARGSQLAALTPRGAP
jgi:hypothetical protein